MNLNNPEILPENYIEAIHKIQNHHPRAVFGGSIALNAVGLLERKVNDIDVFISPNASMDYNILVREDPNTFASETVQDIEGNDIFRMSGTVNGIKCCIFRVPNEWLAHSLITLKGKEINIQNVNYAIQAKLQYMDKDQKHKFDLMSIQDRLNTIDKLIL